MYEGVSNSALADIDVVASAESRYHSHENNGERVYFNAARGGAGASADKHEHDGQEVSAVGERGEVDGVEAGGAGSSGIKKCYQPFIPQREIPVSGIISFEKEKEQSRNEEK